MYLNKVHGEPSLKKMIIGLHNNYQLMAAQTSKSKSSLRITLMVRIKSKREGKDGNNKMMFSPKNQCLVCHMKP